MPLFLIGDEVLDEKVECLVSPIRGRKLYLYTDVDAKIFEKAGRRELENERGNHLVLEMSHPFISSGLSVSETMIHIFISDLILIKNFDVDIYNSYNDTIKLILKGRYKKVVIPPFPYSFKRLGEMNSYRTAVTLIRYFMEKYCIRSNIYIWVGKRAVEDHRNNYVSTYVSTSALSKRHKPLKYPLTNQSEIRIFESTHEGLHKCLYRGQRNYGFTKKNKRYDEIFATKEELSLDDYAFCQRANIHKDELNKILEDENYLPSRNIILSMCLALLYTLTKTNQILVNFNYCLLNPSNLFDQIIIENINKNEYDIFKINEQLFLNDLEQLGSYVKPYIKEGITQKSR